VKRLIATALLFWGLFSVAAYSQSIDFSVSTAVYVGTARTPAVTYRTLFVDKVVYDVTTSRPREVSIIDFRAGKVTLLAPERKVKLELSIQQVLEGSTYFTNHGEFRSSLMRFLRDPQFDVEHGEGTISMRGGPLRYDIATERINNREVVDNYARFCDWAAQLNFFTGGGDPPQARLKLNNQLRQASLVPREIRKTIVNADPTESVTLRSQHDYVWQIGAEDHKLIDALQKDLDAAESVSFEQFVRPRFAQ